MDIYEIFYRIGIGVIGMFIFFIGMGILLFLYKKALDHFKLGTFDPIKGIIVILGILFLIYCIGFELF